jgi:cytidylate kinase
MIITIDGPASSGKGTIAKLLAQHLDAFHLDSGLLYRAIAYYSEENNIEIIDKTLELYSDFINNFHMEYTFCTQKSRILHDNKEITMLLRQQSIGQRASQIAQFPIIRSLITRKIRTLERRFVSIVADGRDMGSIVFPHANFHFYLDASLAIRSQRRYTELVEKGVQATLEDITAEIASRDHQDRSRSIAPLMLIKGSQLISTDTSTPEQVLELILKSMQS